MSNINSKESISKVVNVPRHVAIIMDGNGRWAKKRGHMRLFGHKNGVNSVRGAISTSIEVGVKQLTLFAFSSENWKRPKDEVNGLFELFMIVLEKEIDQLNKNNIRLRVVGDCSRFSDKLNKAIAKAEELTKDNTGLTVNIATNYGGRWDVVQAVNKFITDNPNTQITEQDIANRLVVLDDVDLLIRTGGEFRISNFLLWQVAYGELYITDVLWPDFNKEVYLEAVSNYSKRERRFGCTSEQLVNK